MSSTHTLSPGHEAQGDAGNEPGEPAATNQQRPPTPAASELLPDGPATLRFASSQASGVACLVIRFSVGCALIIPMIIQTILLDPTGAVWTDGAANVSRLDPSVAVQIDAENPSRNRKVEGSNPSSGSKAAGQRPFLALLTARR